MSNFFFPNWLCTRALHMCFHSYMCKDLAHSSQFTHSPQTMLAPRRHTFFLSFASHSLLPPSSFLSCVDVWLHGTHLCLGKRSHRRREAPPGGRRGQGREGQGKRLRENDTQRDRKFDEMVALPRGKLPLLAGTLVPLFCRSLTPSSILFPLMCRCLATRHSLGPRKTVTPPPWSSSWRQARTRRQRTR